MFYFYAARITDVRIDDKYESAFVTIQVSKETAGHLMAEDVVNIEVPAPRLCHD